MKRALVILIMLVMVFPIYAFAEVPNIDDLTKEELIELNADIQAKLNELEPVEPIIVKSGTELIVGKDLPAGTYMVSCLSSTSSVSLYVNGESHDGYIFMDNISAETPVVFVVLAEGVVVRTTVDDLVFTLVPIFK